MTEKERDEELNTWMLVEEYEFQANIMVSGDGDKQLAANRLFRIRKDMHARIHELTQTDTCEFCFPIEDNTITNRPHYIKEEGVELSIAGSKWMCPTCWKFYPFSKTTTRSTLAIGNNTMTVLCPKEHLLASWMDDCMRECCVK